MTKESGLGDQLYLDSTDLSGTTGAISAISAPFAQLTVTDITQSAPHRLAGQLDGTLTFSSWFDPTTAHPKLSALPSADVYGTYFHRTTLGNPAASLVAKQIGYDPNRGADGSLALATTLTANGYGLEWGVQGTAGKRTDTAATNGTGVDGLASTTFGLSAYLHVFSFSGTSVTVAIQDSADNVSFAAVTGGSFTAATGATKERIVTATNLTVRRYLRVVTTGTFSSAVFAVNMVRYRAQPAAS
jgi:hypothetical protein